jgi:hypothetical protein
MTFIDTKYFKEYRQKLGFTNQQDVKKFFAGKDIVPTVDFNYIALFNDRLINIVKKNRHSVQSFNKNQQSRFFLQKKYKLSF